ncbi:hypothetical protein LNAOJCKE_5396 [Methylorubrum aminovorans]|uniref:DUF2149 domain-containing protein n=1 Tax=Methylorubrum aminovorans TaxID=269069 RepID=A0ABQ4UPZ4_9HYPH|nr:DUF2149 domain-containing protein [Methylorubrum aminovorans]GJE68160.1 hypothetical protein LNAOJCKE_5396 [Methylorubrum aminovorans]GMA76885.1 hypothetical protein GCM10025880_33020 [Methylorubrum aminovorans]
MRFLQDDEADDPLLSVINLIDVFLVVIAMLMIAIIQSPSKKFSPQDLSAQQAEQTATIQNSKDLTRYQTSSEMGEGKGVRAGTTYRLPDGRMIYVPD